MDLILKTAFAALIAWAAMCWLVMVFAGWRVIFQRQPGVSYFQLAFGPLSRPDLFTDNGQRSRRIFIRAMQGLFFSLLVVPVAFIGKGFSSSAEDFYPFLALSLVGAVALLLILAALESLLRP